MTVIPITEIDWARDAILNALVEEMTVIDIWKCIENAESCEAFDDAVNELAATMPSEVSENGT